MTGRFPPPEMVTLPGSNVTEPAYYFGRENKQGYTEQNDPKRRFKATDLPPAKKGNVWHKTRVTEGKIYWIEQNKDVVASLDAIAKKEKEEAERLAYIRNTVQRDINAPPPSAAEPAGTLASRGGRAMVNDLVRENARSLEQAFGGKVTVKETVTGAKLELFSRKTGVSTSVDGESIGTVTFDKAGKAVAVDIPGATITEDGRVIVGKSYERYGVSVTFKAAAKPGEIVRGAGSEFVSGIANNVGGKLGNR